jgi:hypothetical protein
MTKPGLRVILWAAGVAAATGIATVAIAASVGVRPGTLSADDVARQLAAEDSSPTPGPSDDGPDDNGQGHDDPTATPTPGGAPSGDALRSQGGTVVARCDGGTVRILSWSPNPGYRADDVIRGPAAKATLVFESDTHNDLLVTVTCSNGTPKLVDKVQGDDHGGWEPGDDHGGATPSPSGSRHDD